MISNTGKLAGKTIFITGASRGIGKAIALKVAKDGANVVIAAKTAQAHPKLQGTIYTAAEEIEKAGGKALPCIVDIRDENQIQAAVNKTVEKFGGIDILINNASAISLTNTPNTDMKRYDLMHNINTRGTFLVSKLCLPHLKKSDHAHILNLSPPLNLNPYWFSSSVAYTMAKYGMSMCVLGMSAEFKSLNVAVNALWPKTLIDTAALSFFGDDSSNHSRKPEIVADSAYVILSRSPSYQTGKFLIDEEVLQEAGVTDFVGYACNPKNADKLRLDGFVDDPAVTGASGFGASASKSAASSGAGPRMFHTSAVKRESENKPDGESGQVANLFGSISKTLSSELVQKTQAVFQFNVKGAEEGVWHLDLKNGNGSCGKGTPPNSPDATLTMDSKNFTEMFAGKLKPATAFMMGKLKISGDMQKAMKLEKLMQSLKSKL